MQAHERYSDAWWQLEYELCMEWNCGPWEFPAVIHPDEICPYPPGTGAATWWPEAQTLYRKLAAA
jgi:hypothetical protein